MAHSMLPPGEASASAHEQSGIYVQPDAQPTAADFESGIYVQPDGAVTDESGRAIPCEDLIGQLRTAIGSTTPVAAVADLQTKALERYNADDDAHADAFSAQALALLNG